MRDRVSTKILDNGATRYGVYDETGKLLRYEYIKLEDEPSTEGDFFNKANMLPDSIPKLLGLKMENPQVKDALNVLAHVGNLHVWERVQSGVTDYLTSTDRNAYPDKSAAGGRDAYYTLGDVVSGATIATLATINTVYITVKKSDSVIVSEDGIVSLPSTATENEVRLDSDWDKDSIFADYKGCFVQLVGNSNVTANIKDVIWIPSDAVFSGLKPITVSKYQPVTGHAAIPANTTITYLGQLGGGARIEVGSYVGTGKSGSSNACAIVCGFVPKLLIVYGKFGFDSSHSANCSISMVVQSGSYYYQGGNSFSISGTVKVSSNTVSFYADSAYAQGNVSKSTYHYFCIG